MKIGVGLRLNLIMFVVVSLGLLIFSASLIVNERNNQLHMLEENGEQVAQLAALSLADPLWNVDESAVEQISKALLLNNDLIHIKIVESSGEVALESGFEPEDQSVDIGNYYFSKDIVKGDETIGTIYLIATSKHIQTSLKEHAKHTIAKAIGIIIFLLFLNAFAVKRFITRPIYALRDSAIRLANGDLEHHIKSLRNDELGSLAKSFIRMQKAIKQKIEDLKTLNHESQKISHAASAKEIFEYLGHLFKAQCQVDSVAFIKKSEKSNDYILAEIHQKNEKISEFLKYLNQEKILPIGRNISFGSQNQYSAVVAKLENDKKNFGLMVLLGLHDKVNYSNSDPELIATLGRLAASRISEINMTEIIRDQNAELETRVKERTASLQEKTRNIRAILKNIQQGIFMIEGEGQTIHEEHSNYLTEILECENISSKSIQDVILSKTDLDENKLDEVSATLFAVTEQCEVSWIANSHLLPKELIYTVNDQKKTIEIDWHPIFDDALVDKILVTIRDVTALRDLERKAKDQEEELGLLTKILDSTSESFQTFLSCSRDYVENSEAVFNKLTTFDEGIYDEILRNLHTLKGNSRSMGFNELARATHQSESLVTILKKNHCIDPCELENAIEPIKVALNYLNHLFETKLMKFGGSSNDIGAYRVATAIQILRAHVNSPELDNKVVSKLITLLDQNDFKDFHEIIKELPDEIENLAKSLGKAHTVLDISGPNLLVEAAQAESLRSILTHIVRNSIDHGIEEESCREKSGKRLQATFSIHWTTEESTALIDIFDDGKGLNLAALKQDKQMTDEQAASRVFSAGTTTAAKITDISGRGIGMNAIRDFLRDMGGDVELCFTGPQINGFRPFKLTLTVPIASSFAESAA